MQQATEIYDKHDITPPKNIRQTLMNVLTPSLRDDAEADAETLHFRRGLPKFLQPINRRIEDLQRNEIGNQDSPKADVNVNQKPVTPKSQRKLKVNGGSVSLPTCVKEIPVTPENKYGFLRSFDGMDTIKKRNHKTCLYFICLQWKFLRICCIQRR